MVLTRQFTSFIGISLLLLTACDDFARDVRRDFGRLTAQSPFPSSPRPTRTVTTATAGRQNVATLVDPKGSSPRDTPSPDKDETVNQAGALWARAKSEISDEQYVEFYKHVSHDFEAPLAWSHNRVEGRKEYTQLLYIPARAPFDLWDREQRRGIKLYVKRVFIMDDADNLMPHYLRFVRGVIDSNDLPLNVSREILQESKDIETMRAASVKRVLTMIEDLAENRKEKFATFWREFGRGFKEGIGADQGNRRGAPARRVCRVRGPCCGNAVQGASV